MSEIRDKVDRQIIYILDIWHNLSKEDTEDIKWRRYFIDQILSIKEIAIVDREAELPEKLLDEINDVAELYALRPTIASSEIAKLLLKEGWVKEISDD